MNTINQESSLNKDLYIDKCGCQIMEGKNGKLNHYNWSDYHILYITEGTGYVKLDGKRVEMTPGSVVIFQPWQYREYDLFRNKISKSYYMHFNGEACEKLIRELKLDTGNIFHIGISLTLTKLLDDLISEFNAKKEHYEYMCYGYAMAILTLISRKLSDTPREYSATRKQISEVCRYIYENCEKITSIGELAQICHLSESRFSHLFSEMMGMSPKNYLLRIRIESSKELLTKTDMSIGEISLAVGLRDQNYFSRLFKRFTNISPSEYRRGFIESIQRDD